MSYICLHNDKREFVDLNKPIKLNITYNNLKTIKCRDLIINEKQPIQHIILYYFSSKSKLLNNLNDLMEKLPNLKDITYDNSLDLYNMKYYYTNNNWNININSNSDDNIIKLINKHVPVINNINNVIINIGYGKLIVKNVNNLIINSDETKTYTLNNNLHKSCNIELFNIKDITFNAPHNIKLADISNIQKLIIYKKYNNIINFCDVIFNSSIYNDFAELLDFKLLIDDEKYTFIKLTDEEINNNNEEDDEVEIVKDNEEENNDDNDRNNKNGNSL